MTNTGTATKRRRRVDGDRLAASLSVSLPEATRERVEALADRYGVALGVVARMAVESGLKAAGEKLRRRAWRDARE